MKDEQAPNTSSDSTKVDGGQLERRAFVRTAGAGALGLGLVAGLPALTGSAMARSSRATASIGLVNAGAGMYTGLDVASQMSTATISRQQVTCGVGTIGLDLSKYTSLVPLIGGALGGTPLGGWTGPFAMLMYSLSVDSYRIDRSQGTLTAKGHMRSITQMAGSTIEDFQHQYLAIAKDGRETSRPSFFVHFKTPFWTATGNPLATPSDTVSGASMFGGSFLVGTVNVT